MTIGALNQSFVNPVVERHVELGFLLEMTGVAKLGLGLYEQKVRIFAVMRRMAGDATDVVLRMHGIDCIHVLSAIRMAA
jgi:hypothetical protein